MPTRVVHRVRCRKPDDGQIWADVKVVDAVTIVAPGGQEMLFWVRAKDAIPFIVDNTGDGNGKGSAPASSTRISHMERIHGEDDPNQKFDIEVLDAMAFLPPPFIPADQA